MKAKLLPLVLLLALSTMGSDCINDPIYVVVNIEGISGVYAINRGDNTFGPPADCRFIDASDYLSDDFSNYKSFRVYDIRIRTIGNFNANVNNGRLLINGVEIMRFSGPWNSFNTPQSMVTSPLIDRSSLNIGFLVNVLANREPVEICGQGALSQPVDRDDLAIEIIVYAQADAEV